jgi:hypothetical protein
MEYEVWIVAFEIGRIQSYGFLETSAECYFAQSVIFVIYKPLPVQF